MNTEQELRPCPFCGGDASIHEFADVPDCGGCHALGPVADTVDDAIAAWNRRSSDEKAEVVAWTWTVVRPGYMDRAWSWGKDRPHGYDATPLYASPPAVAAGEVTEEMLKSALAASASQYEVARNLQSRSPKSYAECFGEATPPELAMRAALTAALAAVGDEGIREWEAESFLTGRGWKNLSCDDQFTLATQIAANIGYDLVPEPEHPDSPHSRAHALPTPPTRGEGE